MSGFAKSIGAIVLALALAGIAGRHGYGQGADPDRGQRNALPRFLRRDARSRDCGRPQDRHGFGGREEPARCGAQSHQVEQAQGRVRKIAAAHGFANLKDWAKTGGAIAHAYIYITTGPSRDAAKDALAKNKQAAMDQLGKLGILSDSSKKKLKDNLDNLEDQLSHEPPPENVAIVKKMQADIDAAVKFGVN